jgi:hypothetical protein
MYTDWPRKDMGAVPVRCADGTIRKARPTGDGCADTFFSIPAFVYASGKRVYGYLTRDDDGYRFVAYTYRKNHHLIAD